MKNRMSFQKSLEQFKQELSMFDTINNVIELQDFIYFLKMNHKKLQTTFPNQYKNLLKEINFIENYKNIANQTKILIKQIDFFIIENSHIIIQIKDKELIFPLKELDDIIQTFFWKRKDFIYFLIMGILSQNDFFSTIQLYCVLISLEH